MKEVQVYLMMYIDINKKHLKLIAIIIIIRVIRLNWVQFKTGNMIMIKMWWFY